MEDAAHTALGKTRGQYISPGRHAADRVVVDPEQMTTAMDNVCAISRRPALAAR